MEEEQDLEEDQEIVEAQNIVEDQDIEEVVDITKLNLFDMMYIALVKYKRKNRVQFEGLEVEAKPHVRTSTCRGTFSSAKYQRIDCWYR